jgi:anti-sigma factor RsiW
MSAPHRIDRQLSAYLDGELTPDEMVEVDRHLTTCPDCRSELDALTANRRLLGRLRQPEPPIGFAEAMAARLDRVPRWRWPAWPRPALAFAGAALVMVLIAVPVVNGYRDRLRAAEVGPDLFIRSAVQSAADDPFIDRAYIGLVSSDANLRLAGEEPRGPAR